MTSSEDPFRRSQPQMGPLGQWVGDRYRIDEFVGKGTYGQVYKAYDAKLDRVVALKVLTATSDRARQRFLREIKTTARLQHPHIVPTHDSGLVGTHPYLVMTYLDGTTLETLASGGRVVSPEHAAAWHRDVAGAIQLAHEMGIVHRDIKPANVIIDKKGKAFVLDFGVASLRETTDVRRLTHDDSSVGTPAYMSPEQLQGQQATERSDVYALGATLYQALTGDVPLSSLQTGQIRPPNEVVEGVPAALNAICLRCLARDPVQRYPSAAALAQELQAFLADDSKPAQSRAPLVAAAVGGAVLVALVGGIGVAVTSGNGDAPPPPPPTDVEGIDQVAIDAALGNARMLATQKAPYEVVARSLDKATAACKGDAALLATVEEARLEVEPPYALREAKELAKVLEPLDAVVARLKDAERGDELRAEARLELLRLYVSRRRAEQATPLAKELALADGPPGLEARFLLACAQRQQGDTEACLKTLEALAEDDAKGSVGACARAARCSLLGEFIGARDHAAAAVELDRTSALALLEHGLALVELVETARAADVLGRVIALRPDSATAHFGLARLLGREARDDAELKRAREALDTALSLTEKPPPGAVRLQGSLHLQSGENAKAKTTLDRALKADRRDVLAYLLRGFAHDNLGDSSAATRDWRQGRLVDAMMFTRHARERSASQRRRLEAALEMKLPPPGLPYPQAETSPAVARSIRARAAKIPENARDEVTTALRLASQGADWTQLELHLQRAMRAAPRSPAVSLERVRLLVGRDRDALALEAIAQARKLGAAAHEVDRWEAETYLRRNDVDEAMKHYGRLAKADPKGVQGLCAAAEISWQKPKTRKQALDYAERAVKLDPEHVPSLLVKGIVLITLGKPKDALAPLGRALELEGAINARVLLMHAVASAEAVLGNERAKRDDRLEVLLQFERLRRVTRGVAARVIGARYALRMPGTLQWSQSVLWEARAFRPNLPQTYLLLGLHGIKTSARRSEVLAFWRLARHHDPQVKIGKPLRQAFSDAYGDVDLDELLLRAE